ncbi:MAG: tetratricopeptide repeat protein, partial [Burkholderiales bacterium]
RKALWYKPDYAEAHNNLGNALKHHGEVDEAIASYGTALSFKPDLADAHYNLATALRDQGRLEEAIASYRKVVSLKADFAEAHNDLGVALRDQDNLEEAVASYRTALSFKPELAETHYNLGIALKAQGRRDEAIACFYKALSRKPDFAEARWAIAVSTIAVVGGTGEAPADRRTEFEVALEDLDNWFGAERVKEGFKAVGSQQPFHLAYQEEDNRDVLFRYGALCSRLMNDWLLRQDLEPARAAPRGNARLGIVSSHFCNHSVWHALVQGWLERLNRDRFELHLFHLGTTQDDQTAFARRGATTFSAGKGGLRRWVEAILAQRPDALIYPDIGMDAMTVKLASMRLAPVQICAWGHPLTTGLPSIDYFVSADGFEPDDAAGHYTEQLIRLPHLGCFYPFMPTDPADLDLGALAIDETLPLLICPGAPFKYAPQHDGVLLDIARKLGRCQFVFFRSHLKEQSELLQHRLRSVFAQGGLRYDDFAVSVPWQPKRAFYALMQRADVYLDTIGFSGFNTAMQAVECGLPIVTREGKFMRGRLASGILKRMGLAELVASNEDAYIALAIRLAKDSEYRQQMRERMRESRNVLFNDRAPIRALEDFLAKAVNANAPSSRRG